LYLHLGKALGQRFPEIFIFLGFYLKTCLSLAHILVSHYHALELGFTSWREIQGAILRLKVKE